MEELSRYELIELLNFHHTMAFEYAQWLFAMAGAYLIAAFYVGESLKTKQVLLLNVGFIFGALQAASQFHFANMNMRGIRYARMEGSTRYLCRSTSWMKVPPLSY
jgi:hypothetical protein